MDNLIYINNENLANYVMFKLDKLENGFTEEELNQITEVVINYKEETDSSFIFLEELLKFNNLKSITLRNGFIYDDNFSIFLNLNNLSEVVFDNCDFENADLIASLKLKSLSLVNCNIETYSFINLLNNLEELTVINGKVEISKINLLNNLRYLQLSYSNILDNELLNINTIEELYIDNTNITNFDFINNLTSLKRLSIDENQYKNNKELFNKLMDNNILVLNENFGGFGGDSNAL
jgi:hypothetical protein